MRLVVPDKTLLYKRLQYTATPQLYVWMDLDRIDCYTVLQYLGCSSLILCIVGCCPYRLVHIFHASCHIALVSERDALLWSDALQFSSFAFLAGMQAGRV